MDQLWFEKKLCSGALVTFQSGLVLFSLVWLWFGLVARPIRAFQFS
jgi:hypothetical protein